VNGQVGALISLVIITSSMRKKEMIREEICVNSLPLVLDIQLDCSDVLSVRKKKFILLKKEKHDSLSV
jgi:hypothetical protein